MSHKNIVAILVAALASVAWADYPSEVLSDSPIGYFRMNETVEAGDLLSSTSGDGHIYDYSTGSYVDVGQWFSHYGTGAIYAVDGIIPDDTSVKFTTTRSSATTSVIPTGYPFTMEVWFRQYSAASSSALVAVSQAENLNGVFAVKLAGNKPQIVTRNGYTLGYASSQTPVDDDSWHYLAIVFDNRDGGGTSAKLYLDGNTSAPIAELDNSKINFVDTINCSTIGTLRYRDRLNDHMSGGMIDEVAIYDYALSNERIEAHFAAGVPARPLADAGADISIRADQNNNPVAVALDASASVADDSAIASYEWTLNGEIIATGVQPTVDFEVGQYLLVLGVTDAEGDKDVDYLNVTIVDGTPVPPVADAGSGQAIYDVDEDGETVTLDGSASNSPDPDGYLVSTIWTDADGSVISDQLTATITLGRGVHTLTLTVTDNYGLTAVDSVDIAVGNEQLLNLPHSRPVFPVPDDIYWPSEVGAPHICLWYGDKFAAMSITIDDNILPQQQWWIDMGNEYGFTPTWFIVVGGVEAGSNPSNNGTWPDYVYLDSVGGDVQSHSMSHHSDDDVRPDDEVHYEYGQSQALINKNVPGHECLTLAYPNGKGRTDIAAEYFIACRGVYGTPNKPGKINWMNTSSVSGNITENMVHPIIYGTSGLSWLNSAEWKRAWLCEHFHQVQDKADTESKLAYIASLSDMIWQGTFVNVAKFGQERDSAEITVTENTESKIAFEITDRMNDLIFNHPLTIKLRIPDSWNGDPIARQNGEVVNYEIKTNGDYDYILVDAVPDRGTVEITAADVTIKPGDANGDNEVDLDDFIILKQNYGLSGASRSQGDFNADGTVDLDDFIILKQNYGS